MHGYSFTIDFGQLGAPSFIGRDRGERARMKLNLAVEEQRCEKITVIVPEYVFTVSSSYFLGLFGESIKAAGSSDRFFQKFDFQCPDFLMHDFEKYVEITLQPNRPII